MHFRSFIVGLLFASTAQSSFVPDHTCTLEEIAPTTVGSVQDANTDSSNIPTSTPHITTVFITITETPTPTGYGSPDNISSSSGNVLPANSSESTSPDQSNVTGYGLSSNGTYGVTATSDAREAQFIHVSLFTLIVSVVIATIMF